MQARAVATVLVGSLLAAALQKESLFPLRLGQTKADLVIVLISCCAMIWGIRGGLLSGVLAGVLQGLAQGASIGSVIASRTFSGYIAGRAAVVVAPGQVLMAAPLAFATTLVCELIYYLFSPWAPFQAWVRVVAGEALFNAGLALLVHWLLMRAGGKARAS